MGISNRVPEMMAAFARKRAQDKDIAEATAAVEQFNARAKARLATVAWPIGAALISRHHWAHILCQSCNLINEMDLRVKRRNAAQPVNVICRMPDVRDATGMADRSSSRSVEISLGQ